MMMRSEQPAAIASRLRAVIYLVQLTLLVVPGAVLLTLVLGGAPWAPACLVGWITAGLLGLSGWWTADRAMRGDQIQFMKYVVGGMLARLLGCGLATGVVVGGGLLQPTPFVVGLLTGLFAFMGVEVAGLLSWSKRLAMEAPRPGPTGAPGEVTSRG